MMRTRGRNQEAYDRFERAVETPLLVLSLIFIPIVLVPLLADLSAEANKLLDTLSWIIWACFVVEYATLLWLAPDRGKMVRTHLFDLAVITLPFLRPVRAFRLLRAAAGLGAAITLCRSVLRRKSLGWFLLGVIIVICLGAGLVTFFEHDADGASIADFADGIWWALVTTTTVGYGDHAPVTAAGRGVAAILMIVGVALLGTLTANLAAWFVEHDEEDEIAQLQAELAAVHVKLDRLLAQVPATEAESS